MSFGMLCTHPCTLQKGCSPIWHFRNDLSLSGMQKVALPPVLAPPKRKGRKPARSGNGSKKAAPKRGRPIKLPVLDTANNDGTDTMAAMMTLPELVSPSWSDLRHYGRKLLDMTPQTSIRKLTRGAGGQSGWAQTSFGAAAGPFTERMALGKPTAGSPSAVLGVKQEFCCRSEAGGEVP